MGKTVAFSGAIWERRIDIGCTIPSLKLLVTSLKNSDDFSNDHTTDRSVYNNS